MPHLQHTHKPLIINKKLRQITCNHLQHLPQPSLIGSSVAGTPPFYSSGKSMG